MAPIFELSGFAAILLLSLVQPLLWPFWIFLLLLATMLVIYAMTLGYVATSINVCEQAFPRFARRKTLQFLTNWGTMATPDDDPTGFAGSLAAKPFSF